MVRAFQDVTGYFYLPMPYWNHAKLSLRATGQPRVVCWQITRCNNSYSSEDAGYLNAQASYFSGDVSGWRSILNVKNSWGHVVRAIKNIQFNVIRRRNFGILFRYLICRWRFCRMLTTFELNATCHWTTAGLSFKRITWCLWTEGGRLPCKGQVSIDLKMFQGKYSSFSVFRFWRLLQLRARFRARWKHDVRVRRQPPRCSQAQGTAHVARIPLPRPWPRDLQQRR